MKANKEIKNELRHNGETMKVSYDKKKKVLTIYGNGTSIFYDNPIFDNNDGSMKDMPISIVFHGFTIISKKLSKQYVKNMEYGKVES